MYSIVVLHWRRENLYRFVPAERQNFAPHGGLLRLDAAPKPQRSKAATPSRLTARRCGGASPPPKPARGRAYFSLGRKFSAAPPNPFQFAGANAYGFGPFTFLLPALFLSQREMNQGEKSALFGPSGGQNG